MLDLHFLAFVAYGVTAALAAVPLLRISEPPLSTVGARVAATAAVVLHLAALVLYTAQSGVLPLTGLAPALSSLAFLVGLLCAGVVWLTGELAILLLGLPLVLGPLGLALLSGFGVAPADVEPSGWFLLHTTLSLVGLALFGVASVASVLYLVQHRELKGRRFGAMVQFVPPLEQLDRLNHLALLTGFPALTLGIVLAVVFTLGSAAPLVENPAHRGWGVLSWAAFGMIAVLRLHGSLRGRRAAYFSVLAFAIVAVSYVILLVTVGGEGARFL